MRMKLNAQTSRTLLVLSTLVLALAATAMPADAGIGIGGRGGIVRDPDDDDSMTTWGGLVRFTGGFLGLEVALDKWEREVGGTEIEMTPVTVGLLFFPFKYGYVGAGAGRYGTDIDSPAFLGLEDGSDATAGYDVRAGLQIPIVPKFHLIGDVRYMFVNTDFDDLDDSSLNDSDAVALTAGALIYLPGS